MSKYKIVVYSEMIVDEEDYKNYIADQEYKWDVDNHDQIEKLKKKGECVLSDEVGSTMINIFRVVQL